MVTGRSGGSHATSREWPACLTAESKRHDGADHVRGCEPARSVAIVEAERVARRSSPSRATTRDLNSKLPEFRFEFPKKRTHWRPFDSQTDAMKERASAPVVKV